MCSFFFTCPHKFLCAQNKLYQDHPRAGWTVSGWPCVRKWRSSVLIKAQRGHRNSDNNCRTSIAYILEKFKRRATTNKIIWLVIHRDRQKLSLEHGTANNLWWKSNFKQICFNFFTKEDYVVIGSWFQIVGAATEKACLPIFSLGSGTKCWLERRAIVGNVI